VVYSRVIADARPTNWVDRWSPQFLHPLLKLGRFDRPIGTWLLLWPCWWGIAVATPEGAFPDFRLLVLFALGALVMRSAGCAFNDIADRNFDNQVERTEARPLASGQVSLREAVLFFCLMCLLGLLVLIQLNTYTIILGVASLVLIAIYPFMKRVTYWPQLVLGLTFNWGALLGWTAVTGKLGLIPAILYTAGLFWTLGYDTIYAHMDKTDDILVGVKSTALKFGENTRAWLFVFYGMAVGLFVLVGLEAHMKPIYYFGIFAVVLHFRYQIEHLNIHDPSNCLRIFKSNLTVGLILFLSIVASKWIIL